MNEKSRIGTCITDENGRVAGIEREFFRQGWIFKDRAAFQEKPESPCYVPELSDHVYTGSDILAMCGGRKELASIVFESLDWQHPETLLDDWLSEKEDLEGNTGGFQRESRSCILDKGKV